MHVCIMPFQTFFDLSQLSWDQNWFNNGKLYFVWITQIVVYSNQFLMIAAQMCIAWNSELNSRINWILSFKLFYGFSQ